MKRGKSKTSLKNSKKVKVVLGIFALVLISAVFVYAGLILNGKAYQINPGQSQRINNWSICKNVTNNGPLPIFVPINTPSEWSNFISNKPSYVNITDCSCTPNCAGRVCGLDPVCGTSCGPACPVGQTCNSLGQCVCEPYCPWFYECGDDGCGGVCGTCSSGEVCDESNQCQTAKPTCSYEECLAENYCDCSIFRIGAQDFECATRCYFYICNDETGLCEYDHYNNIAPPSDTDPTCITGAPCR